VSHHSERNTAFLFGSFLDSEFFLPRWLPVVLGMRRGETSFEACSQFRRSMTAVLAAQIFDNLVGCSRKELVRTLSKVGAILTLRF
jgi:hypothetical protein